MLFSSRRLVQCGLVERGERESPVVRDEGGLRKGYETSLVYTVYSIGLYIP